MARQPEQDSKEPAAQIDARPRRRRRALRAVGLLALLIATTLLVGGWILRYDGEVASHNLTGDGSHVVMVHPCGWEAVYDSAGALVENPIDAGSYNFFNAWEDPWLHQAADRLPWLLLGNLDGDTTRFSQRFAAWLSDIWGASGQALRGATEGRFRPGYGRRADADCTRPPEGSP